jgi:DNA-binding LytR/AlgR family response regulator
MTPMNPLRTLIVDDEALARSRLRRLLAGAFITGEFDFQLGMFVESRRNDYQRP